jgi:hypothetical protein
MGSILPSKVSIDHECHAQSIRESAAAQLGRFQIFQRAPNAMQGMQEQRTRARPRPTMRVQLQAACSGQMGQICSKSLPAEASPCFVFGEDSRGDEVLWTRRVRQERVSTAEGETAAGGRP